MITVRSGVVACGAAMFDFLKKEENNGLFEIFEGEKVLVIDVVGYDSLRDNKFVKLVDRYVP